MKVIVKFDEAKYTDIPFELDERQLNALRVLLGHYTGPGCRVEFEVEQKRPIEETGAVRTCRADVLEGMPALEVPKKEDPGLTFEELSRAVEGAAAAMREGARMEVDEDE